MDHLDVKAHIHVKLDQKTIWVNTALVLQIAPNIANQMSITVQRAMMKMAADYPIAARRKKEGLMENCAISIAQNYVMITKFSVREDSMKLDAGQQALVEIKKYTDGEKVLNQIPQKSAPDTVQPSVKATKSCALHN